MNDYLDNDLQTAIDAAENGELTEWEEQQMDEQAKKVQQWQQRKQQKAGMALQTKLVNEGLKQAAEELGMQPEELANLAAQNPQAAEELYRTGVKNFYKGVHQQARDPRTGRFVSNQQPAQPHQMQWPQGQPVQRQTPDGFMPQRATLPNSEQRVTKATEIAQKSTGTNDDMERILGALLPDNDPFVQYGQ
jgi:hypothetical protein